MTVTTVRATGRRRFCDGHAGLMDTIVDWLRGLAAAQEPAPVSLAAAG